MPLVKYENSPNFDENLVCTGCKWYPTKTDAAADRIYEMIDHEKIILQTEISMVQILRGVYRAFELAETQNAGAQFVYPDSLDPLDWQYLKSFTNGRNTADTEVNSED